MAEKNSLKEEKMENLNWLLEKYLLLAENSVDCIWTLDKDLRFTYLSPSLERILGFKPEEWIGTSIKTHLSQEEYRRTLKIIDEALADYNNQNYRLITFETKAFNKQNAEVDLEITGKVLLNEEEKLIGFQGTIRDISERKEAEEKISQSEEFQRAIINCSPLAIYSIDLNGNVLTWNKSAEKLFGWKTVEVLGKPLPIVQEEKYQEFAELRKKVQSGKEFIGKEIIRQKKDGNLIPISLSVASIKNKNGELVGIMGAAENITKRKLMEKKLQESEAKYRSMFENMASANCIDEIVYKNGHAVDYRILDVNHAYEKMHGIKREQAIGALASELYGTGEAPYLDIYSKVANSGKPAYFEAYFEPMQEYLYITVGSPKPGFFTVIANNIGKLKRTENELRKLKNNLQAQVEEKTKELQERIAELERFHQATIDREFRIKELKDEIKRLKGEK